MKNTSDSENVFQLQSDLVETLINSGYIQSTEIAEAFRTVPRHLFTPGVPLERVYSDNSIPTKRADGRLISSSSQPAIMAIMLEQLDLRPGYRVLEIGAGTGFNAALMRHLVGDSGLVVTVDIDEDIVENARAHLNAAGMDDVKVICGDGGFGYADQAPYDRIVLTVAASDIAPEWWNQLKPDGRLLLPLGISTVIQKSVAFEIKDGYFESVSVKDCGFMILRGAFAKEPNTRTLGSEPGITLTLNDDVTINNDSMYEILCEPGEDQPVGIQTTLFEVGAGLFLWLGLREPDFCVLAAEGEAARKGIVPCFFIYGGGAVGCGTIGITDGKRLCVFIRQSGSEVSYNEVCKLYMRSYGSGNDLAERLIEQTRAWDEAGRPSTNGLHMRVYPKGATYIPEAGEYLIEKQWTDLVLSWDNQPFAGTK